MITFLNKQVEQEVKEYLRNNPKTKEEFRKMWDDGFYEYNCYQVCKNEEIWIIKEYTVCEDFRLSDTGLELWSTDISN